MNCDVFNEARDGAKFFQAQIGEGCGFEQRCGDNCLLYGLGDTPKARVLQILREKLWQEVGKKQMAKFYRKLEQHEAIAARA